MSQQKRKLVSNAIRIVEKLLKNNEMRKPNKKMKLNQNRSREKLWIN
jgi:hypothetical protein